MHCRCKCHGGIIVEKILCKFCSSHLNSSTLMYVVLLVRSPVKKMFRFQSGDAASPTAGAPLGSPYAVSPVGREAPLGSPLASPKRAQRKIAPLAFQGKAQYMYPHLQHLLGH